MKTVTGSVVFLTLILLPLFAQAASESFGEYTVYYQAVNSTFVDAEIAQQYGIVRSDRRAFLNISVIRDDSVPVAASVSGGKRNLLGQVGDILFREIREGPAIYYIGEFEFSNAEHVRFSVEVTGESHEIRWEVQLFNN